MSLLPVQKAKPCSSITYLRHKRATSHSTWGVRGWSLGWRLEESETGKKVTSLCSFCSSLSHLVLKVIGTGSSNKTNKDVSGLFQTTIFFKRRFITVWIIPTRKAFSAGSVSRDPSNSYFQGLGSVFFFLSLVIKSRFFLILETWYSVRSVLNAPKTI